MRVGFFSFYSYLKNREIKIFIEIILGFCGVFVLLEKISISGKCIWFLEIWKLELLVGLIRIVLFFWVRVMRSIFNLSYLVGFLYYINDIKGLGSRRKN